MDFIYSLSKELSESSFMCLSGKRSSKKRWQFQVYISVDTMFPNGYITLASPQDGPPAVGNRHTREQKL